ncbi:DNA damage-inducible transcript 3 protein [Hypomesus transpacificus]|uniref:DNA damage-inducible transcript 3 protein n=1 Tax=Hypomesus transpacificus TaxID=137520 RepID=UPI001F07513D|nr:DNA damage-inducible transcript 3 protein [Hypomesus transpacificus]XP_046870217.1 DNA damage-inducible transcript 3 protein [Hypomesus transpacificus]
MTAEWLHLPPPYPPGVGPLCGAELEAWYEDLQDILGSDAGGAKLARPPPCSEKEPEFLDVLESCSLTWLTDGGQGSWGEAVVQRVTEESSAPHHDHTSSSTSMSPEQLEGEQAREGEGSGGDLLPPEFFELLSEGGVGMMENGGVAVGGGYHHLPHHHPHHHGNVQPASPSSEEELPCVPDSPSSSSSSSSQSPSHNCSPPSSPPSSPTHFSSQLGKRKRSSAPSPFPSSGSRSSSSSSSVKKSRKEREQENERKVQELSEQNERLKAEIERLGEEVQRTRRALIERLVNTRK